MGIKIVSMVGEGGGPPKWGGREKWVVDGDAVALDIPPFWGQVEARRLAGFTMFESTLLPAEFVRCVNEYATAVLVPNEFCRWVYDQQTKAPVYVVPLGVDTLKFRSVMRERQSGPYTFLWSGTPDARKGWDVAYRSFCRAFGDRSDVRLLLHFRHPLVGDPPFSDENVSVVSGKLSDAVWLDMLKSADAMLYPTRGEGHGMVPREAAATGLPVICTEWGGLENCGRWALPVQVKKLIPATYGSFDRGTIGQWAAPDEDSVIAHMRWCVDNPLKAAERGRAGAEVIHSEQGWLRCAVTLYSWMEDHGWLS
jgi:glycosyltransferase involved in cell wall biosynthesis